MSDFWEAYKSEVLPAVKKKKIAATQPVAEKAAARKNAGQEMVKLHKLGASQPLPDSKQPLERKREKALRQGAIEVDAKLDLHGMTQAEAFDALTVFMAKKTSNGKRHLLIITGKGAGGEGVLRKNLQAWLRQLPEAKNILAIRPAAPRHGGDGAFYVFMRKK